MICIPWWFMGLCFLLQVEKLQLELDLKAGLREVLETRTKELEKKMLEVDPKIQDVSSYINVFVMYYMLLSKWESKLI